jgi:hypothetical protein
MQGTIIKTLPRGDPELGLRLMVWCCLVSKLVLTSDPCYIPVQWHHGCMKLSTTMSSNTITWKNSIGSTSFKANNRPGSWAATVAGIAGIWTSEEVAEFIALLPEMVATDDGYRIDGHCWLSTDWLLRKTNSGSCSRSSRRLHSGQQPPAVRCDVKTV